MTASKWLGKWKIAGICFMGYWGAVCFRRCQRNRHFQHARGRHSAPSVRDALGLLVVLLACTACDPVSLSA